MSSTNGGLGFFNTNWSFEEVKRATWTAEEDKRFEEALAFLEDRDSTETWSKIADSIPGKTVDDVIERYKKLEDDISDIEAGLVPTPSYRCNASSENSGIGYVVGGKRSFPAMSDGFRLPMMPEKERKKGVPWTEEEHRRFLMGLKKYGKGDWRNIARNFVTTRTPTQVASHAQKYFIRQLTDCKDKRRSSIHDITTANVPDANAPLTTTAAAVSTTPTNTLDAFPQWS